MEGVGTAPLAVRFRVGFLSRFGSVLSLLQYCAAEEKRVLMSRKAYLLAIAVSVSILSGANAAVIQVQSDILDYEAHKTVSSGVLAVSNGTVGDNRIGSRTTTTLSSSILPFALPAIPGGEAITAATLNVTFKGESASLKIEAGDGNVDLYGLPYDAAPFAQDANRYFSGPNDATVGVSKLQNDYFTVGEYPAENTNVTKVSADISTFLKSLYSAGAVAGDFAVLRLKLRYRRAQRQQSLSNRNIRRRRRHGRRLTTRDCRWRFPS